MALCDMVIKGVTHEIPSSHSCVTCLLEARAYLFIFPINTISLSLLEARLAPLLQGMVSGTPPFSPTTYAHIGMLAETACLPAHVQETPCPCRDLAPYFIEVLRIAMLQNGLTLAPTSCLSTSTQHSESCRHSLSVRSPPTFENCITPQLPI